MHPNAAFRPDLAPADERALLEALIDEIGFATIFAATPDGPRVAHVPLLQTGDGAVQFHLARGNALARHLDGMTALALVNGPDGYISPRWYDDAAQVPTWNYVAVELEGRVRRMDADGLLGHLEVLTTRQEARADDYADALDKLKGARVLLVEDNDMNQELAMELLSQAGMTVVVANNGQEAVDILTKGGQQFDGVLMDCQMPVMDGYTATREIRKLAQFKDLPIIAMTANAMAGDKEKVIEAGMWDHISKPLNVQAMFNTMAKWIKPVARPAAPVLSADVPAPVNATSPLAGLKKNVAEKAIQKSDEGQFDSLNKAPKVQSTAADPFAALVGIDVKAGLATTMDNPKLYTRLLNKFKDTQSRFAELFEQALADADSSAPARMAHTLKGTAGNIGAKGVQAAAAELEHACLTGEPVDRQQALLQNVLRVLAPVVQGLRAFAGEVSLPVPVSVGTADSPVASITPAQTTGPASADLDRLAALLQDSDAEAMDLLDAVMEQANDAALRDGLRRVARAVENFDFDAALLALQQARG